MSNNQANPSPTAIPGIAVPMGMASSEEKTRLSKDAERSCLLGVLSFFCCPLCISPYAIYLGLRAKKEIKANSDEVTGKCEANSGIATASIALILSIVALIIFIKMYISYMAEMAAVYGN